MNYPKQPRHPPVHAFATESVDNALLDETAAAAYLDLRPGTLSVWRSTRRYKLPYVKIGACVRYRKGDLDAFVQARTVDPEAA